MSHADHFNALFADDADPWGYGSSWVEQRRHSLLMSMLPKQRVRRAFEPACATGLLTALLARRADTLVAWDASTVAVDLARTRLCDAANVELAVGLVPEDWPTGQFDLIVLADFLYYLPADDILRVISRTVASLEPGGTVLACHWRGTAHDFDTVNGDEVHRLMRAALPESMCTYKDVDYLIEGWTP